MNTLTSLCDVPTVRHEPKTYPLRYCTGGCRNGAHSAHTYDVDPVDGPMRNTFLCPGNQSQVSEWLDEDNGERTGYGFIATI